MDAYRSACDSIAEAIAAGHIPADTQTWLSQESTLNTTVLIDHRLILVIRFQFKHVMHSTFDVADDGQ